MPAAQYLSIRYSSRLAEAGISPSVGSVGDSYDNALAESVIGLYKVEERRRHRIRPLVVVESREQRSCYCLGDPADQLRP